MKLYTADTAKVIADISALIASENMTVDYEYDAESDAFYTVVRIFKEKIDGSLQYPSVVAPNNMQAATYSALSLAKSTDRYSVVINAGIFNTATMKQRGTLILDGSVLQDVVDPDTDGALLLTIDSNGDLGYAQPDVPANTLISNGIQSCVLGWNPLIVDYDDFDVPQALQTRVGELQAQRQIIGQWGNGDYGIVTCEGRAYHHSDGWTYAEAKKILKRLGLKFAYNLDGGGSTETVIGKKQINTVYEGTTGRIVPTFIAFRL